jgi:hypothetical protein
MVNAINPDVVAVLVAPFLPKQSSFKDKSNEWISEH